MGSGGTAKGEPGKLLPGRYTQPIARVGTRQTRLIFASGRGALIGVAIGRAAGLRAIASADAEAVFRFAPNETKGDKGLFRNATVATRPPARRSRPHLISTCPPVAGPVVSIQNHWCCPVLGVTPMTYMRPHPPEYSGSRAAAILRLGLNGKPISGNRHGP